MKDYKKAKEEYDSAKKEGKKVKNPGRAPSAPRRPRRQHPGNEPVDYPIRLRKIIVSMHPHILYVDEERPLENRVIFLDRLGIIDAPEGI